MGLRYSQQAAGVLRTLPPPTKKAVRAAIDVLRKDALGAPGLNVRALELPAGKAPLYRVRVGDYRIAYFIEGQDVVVSRVFHRRDGYGWLERLG